MRSFAATSNTHKTSRARYETWPTFDMIAALATPPDMQLWDELAAGQGRPDLSAEVLVARRNGFLQRAIDRLG
jgi:hypothetical protein